MGSEPPSPPQITLPVTSPCYRLSVHGRLLLENLLESHPGIEEFSLERDLRGAILHVRAVVRDDEAKARLHELVARTIGRNFAEERLAVFTSGNNGAPSGRVLLEEVETTMRDGEVSVLVALAADQRSSQARRSGARQHGATLRLAAEATLEALSDLVQWNASVAVDQADVIGSEWGSKWADGEALVLVGLILQSPRATTRLYGVSRATSGVHEAAAAKAVLSAVNRLIA